MKNFSFNQDKSIEKRCKQKNGFAWGIAKQLLEILVSGRFIRWRKKQTLIKLTLSLTHILGKFDFKHEKTDKLKLAAPKFFSVGAKLLALWAWASIIAIRFHWFISCFELTILIFQFRQPSEDLLTNYWSLRA